ncbi:DtxR family transcriptional regulator [Salinibacter sp. 10B]|uniref:metal-dependent transcriptional regulator n=1 Tax=Salinibacter sp. 10B TaxID=1923971 RepID=UPI000CF4AA50|nr:metal-dependent transcriptional regulator [Salinibacter sp. 10B]PQJ35729.1 DtxR family transcriptional regulator [Salinibacter sp. 10B]
MRSPSIEDYLKAIYKLEEREDSPPVSTGDVAQSMEVSPASASNMIKRLDDLGFLTYEAYEGATLTKLGRTVALEVIRHHRLLELYLKEVMGFSWDEIHEEAEILEHHISERFESRIEEMLGNPTRDPHGHPIPTRDGTMDELPTRSLADLEEEDAATIDHIADEDGDLLDLLEQRGLLPGASVEMRETRPLDGLFVVAVNGTEQLIGQPVAQKVVVEPLPSA